MSVELTKSVRPDGRRLVTFRIDNTTEGTSIQMSESDLRSLVEQATEALRPEPESVEKGVWRHEDGTACTSYPDSIDWTYVIPEHPGSSFKCHHGMVHSEKRVSVLGSGGEPDGLHEV